MLNKKNINIFKLLLTLSLDLKTGYLPCLLFTLSFRYFGTVSSAMITHEFIRDHGTKKKKDIIRFFMTVKGMRSSEFRKVITASDSAIIAFELVNRDTYIHR